MRVIRDRDRFQARVRPDRAEQGPDVVAHRLGAQLQLVGDLARRSPALEQLEDLRLTRRTRTSPAFGSARSSS